MKNLQTSQRVKRMLETDRMGIYSGQESVIRRDIERLLAEYFCLKQPPKVIIEGTVDELEISIHALAGAVKRFNLLK